MVSKKASVPSHRLYAPLRVHIYIDAGFGKMLLIHEKIVGMSGDAHLANHGEHRGSPRSSQERKKRNRWSDARAISAYVARNSVIVLRIAVIHESHSGGSRPWA